MNSMLWAVFFDDLTASEAAHEKRRIHSTVTRHGGEPVKRQSS